MALGRLRRRELDGVRAKPGTHPGLWLDKYLAHDGDGAKAECIGGAVEAGVSGEYSRAFRRWSASFDSRLSRSFDVTTAGRLVIGLGAKGPVEAGLHIDHTWGIPVLPGTALKGLASRTAHRLLEGNGWRRPSSAGNLDGGEFHEFLFGTTRRSGAVLFHDAWWIAGQQRPPLERDVMTVHHPEYYQNPDNPKPPSDFDSPTPIPFVTASGAFRIVLERASLDIDESWLATAREILKHGLEQEGLGAKTNAGYGRFSVGAFS
jgi:CRISPR-associated protein Cmr6